MRCYARDANPVPVVTQSGIRTTALADYDSRVDMCCEHFYELTPSAFHGPEWPYSEVSFTFVGKGVVHLQY